jgi:parallel beta-helix repeat protein
MLRFVLAMFALRLSVLALVGGVLLAAADPASARRIVIAPGPGTPVQDAIDIAGPGDTLRLTDGTYPEAIVIDKPLRLEGRNAIIDAGCTASTAVQIAAGAVTLRRLTVRGGSFYTIDATGRDRTVIDRVSVQPSCVGVEYGINVFQGTNMRIRNNSIVDPAGFGDAAIYIGGTPPDADLRIEKNVIMGPNDRGIIVEDSADNPGRPVGVRVRKNEITGAATGIWVFGSAYAEIVGNEVDGSANAGIELTVNSSDNVITGNRLTGNNPDVLDAGSNNCWRHNQYTTGSVPDC